MATFLILSAHPGAASFTAAWARASVEAARALGHEVLTSDLHAMGFDPVEPFADPLKDHEAAWESGALDPAVEAEVEKLQAADRVILHFPVWWFAPPGILKGWCERVLVHGGLHDVAHRFDTGRLRGKRALFCVTTGARAEEVGPRGKEGRLDLLLWPLAYTLRYSGMEVAEPVAVHGVHGYHEGAAREALEARLARVLADQRGVIEGLDHREPWPFHPDGDFDDTGRLRDGIAPLSPFHG